MSRTCLPVDAWPEPDRSAWDAAHRRGGLLDDDGLAVSWASGTTDIISRGYGRFLTFLATIGQLDLLAGPAERITRDRIETYIAYLRQRNHPNTVAARLRELSRAVAVMAPDFDRVWLLRVVARLRRSATRARDDRPRLMPAETLERLWAELTRRAESNPIASARRAGLYRDGLMIAFLCITPIRARSMAALAVGTTLQRRGDEWWVNLAAQHTKNKRPYEAPLVGLTDAIDTYLERFRPQLLSRSKMPATSAAMWVSLTGKALTPKQVGQVVTRRTKIELGRGLNTHLFRKIVPTELAIRDPGHVGAAQPILGHADYRTTEEAYNLGRTLDAARRHQELLHSLHPRWCPAPGPGAWPQQAADPGSEVLSPKIPAGRLSGRKQKFPNGS